MPHHSPPRGQPVPYEPYDAMGHFENFIAPPTLDRVERELVSAFCRRYVVWLVRAGRGRSHRRIAGAMDLAAWANRAPLRDEERGPIGALGGPVPRHPTIWGGAGRLRRRRS